MASKTTTQGWSLLGSFLLLSTLVGCATSPSHPPTFSDFQRAFREDAANTNFESQVALFAAAQLSQRELRRFRDERNAEKLVGAGTQAGFNDPFGRVLAARATRLSPSWPVAWAALAYRDMSLLQDRANNSETIAAELTMALHRWRSLEPTNSAPLYLEASFQCLRSNVTAAKRLIAEAATKDAFETCSVPIQKCVIQALESADRSQFTARRYAMGQGVGFVSWSKLSKSILGDNPPDQEALRNCFLLGARLGQGKTFLEQLIGDSIQSKAIEKITGGDFATEKSRISERKARIKRATAYENSLHNRNINEARWVRYLDDCFDKGEMPAIELMAEDNGDSF